MTASLIAAVVILFAMLEEPWVGMAMGAFWLAIVKPVFGEALDDAAVMMITSWIG